MDDARRGIVGNDVTVLDCGYVDTRRGQVLTRQLFAEKREKKRTQEINVQWRSIIAIRKDKAAQDRLYQIRKMVLQRRANLA